jgi:hypothetical protein
MAMTTITMPTTTAATVMTNRVTMAWQWLLLLPHWIGYGSGDDTDG